VLRRRRRDFWRVKYLKETFSIHPRKQRHFCDKDQGAGDKNNPALEHVQKTIGILRPPVIDKDTNDTNAQAVHQNRDWDRG